MPSRRMLELATLSGPPVVAGGFTVTPRSQALIVRLPLGGFVWNRPASVLLAGQGRVESIPVVDLTRIVQLGLLGLALIFILVAGARSSRRKE